MPRRGEGSVRRLASTKKMRKEEAPPTTRRRRREAGGTTAAETGQPRKEEGEEPATRSATRREEQAETRTGRPHTRETTSQPERAAGRERERKNTPKKSAGRAPAGRGPRAKLGWVFFLSLSPPPGLARRLSLGMERSARSWSPPRPGTAHHEAGPPPPSRLTRAASGPPAPPPTGDGGGRFPLSREVASRGGTPPLAVALPYDSFFAFKNAASPVRRSEHSEWSRGSFGRSWSSERSVDQGGYRKSGRCSKRAVRRS